MSVRSDFPIFENNPELIYLDTTATAQKPKAVIDAMVRFLSYDYSNIHRGAYDLSERSELLYEKSKEKVAHWINAESPYEIVYGANSTSLFNMLAQSLARSMWLRKGDRVLLSVIEHHANVVPWLILREDLGIEVEFVGINGDFDIDLEDLRSKYTPNTRIVATTMVSNVTGKIMDIGRLKSFIDTLPPVENGPFERPLLVLDASQAVPNFKVDVRKLGADFVIFTGHKIYADTGIGVLYGKKSLLKTMTPGIGGGGAINYVREDSFEFAGLPNRFEPGTQNLTGAVSVLAALEYLDSIGGYEKLHEIEVPLIEYALEEFAKLSPKVRLVGPLTASERVGIFSFTIEGMHVSDVAEALADEGIAVRAGQHCAEPLHRRIGCLSTVRASIGIYTTKSDLKKFFSTLEKIVNE